MSDNTAAPSTTKTKSASETPGQSPSLGAPFRPPKQEAYRPTPPGRIPAQPTGGGASPSRSAMPENKKLLVGRDIVLSGAISACDALVVEGRVETDLSDALMIEILPSGTFLGQAVVDHADIAGTFDGDLTVRKKLTLSRSGRISGTIRYAALEVEAGGQLNGTIEPLDEAPPAVHHRSPRQEAGDRAEETRQ